jgi:hypothetical protein
VSGTLAPDKPAVKGLTFLSAPDYGEGGGILRTIRVITGHRDYYLADPASLDQVRRDVLAAVQAGGGLIDFVDRSGREVTLLVSPNLPLVFEVVERADEPDDGDEGSFVPLQLDYEF